MQIATPRQSSVYEPIILGHVAGMGKAWGTAIDKVESQRTWQDGTALVDRMTMIDGLIRLSKARRDTLINHYRRLCWVGPGYIPKALYEHHVRELLDGAKKHQTPVATAAEVFLFLHTEASKAPLSRAAGQCYAKLAKSIFGLTCKMPRASAQDRNLAMDTIIQRLLRERIRSTTRHH